MLHRPPRDVSSCRIGDHVRSEHHLGEGEGLGCSRFGGSSECSVFRPCGISGFALAAMPQPGDVRSRLAVAGPRPTVNT